MSRPSPIDRKLDKMRQSIYSQLFQQNNGADPEIRIKPLVAALLWIWGYRW